jgi:hypothetical protein
MFKMRFPSILREMFLILICEYITLKPFTQQALGNITVYIMGLIIC